MIPRKAVNVQDNNLFVFIINSENKVIQTPIEVGHSSADYTQIDAGIKAGDQVVIESLSANIKDGAEVEIVEVQETL